MTEKIALTQQLEVMHTLQRQLRLNGTEFRTLLEGVSYPLAQCDNC